MNLSGKISEGTGKWAVAAESRDVAEGFRCLISTTIFTPEGNFTHEFKDSRTFCTEQEAVLQGLREGMVWIDLKISRTIRT
jgi:hypothetical protein